MQAQGATTTVPADGARDSQANEIWLFRMGGVLDAFYRVAVKTGVSGTGAVTINDNTVGPRRAGGQHQARDGQHRPAEHASSASTARTTTARSR
jgi:hypothetical protein